MRRAAAIAAALLVCGTSLGLAQTPPARIRIDPPPTGSARATASLTPAQLQRLRQAIAYRESGLAERAEELLRGLLAELPGHRLVATELGRSLASRQDWPALERFARAERAAAHDSLLLAREHAQALERLGRVRDAAQVVAEAWIAGPAEAEWAVAALTRLAAADPRGVREVLQRAMERRSDRTDLALALARIEWRAGDSRAATRTLFAADRPATRPTPLRWVFAEDLLRGMTPRDSSGALEALSDLAADTRFEPPYRTAAARRAWLVATARGQEAESAGKLWRGIRDLPAVHWEPSFLVSLSRGLRRAGLAAESRAALEAAGERDAGAPEVELENALAELRDGPPARALPRLEKLAPTSPEAAWRFAEALFFAGQVDSAMSWYQRISSDPAGAWAGASLERLFLLEDAQPREALVPFGRMAWEEWRAEPKQALALAESLSAALPRGALWAQATFELSRHRELAGDAAGALAAALAIADSLPDDRLAPRARQRAGDLLLEKLQDPARAMAQYEECLARYPRAWNAPEVRRKLELLRRPRRTST